MAPPLVRACAREGDDVRAVELLLGQGHAGRLEESAAGGGLTALMAACKQGNFSCVERLLHAGAHADAVDDKGFTPLLWACRYKHAACVDGTAASAQKLEEETHNLSIHQSPLSTGVFWGGSVLSKLQNEPFEYT